MLYETLFQGKMFFAMLFFGVLCGIILTAKNIFDNTIKNKKILAKIILPTSDIFCIIIFSLIFLYGLNKFCYGNFRLFNLVGFCLGIFLEQISLEKIVEKILHWVYNFFVKIFAKLKKFKLFAKILR